MKAVVFDTWGGPETLELREVPPPEVGPGEVRLKVRAVSVNRTLGIEVNQRGADWHIPLPHRLGADPAGEVDAVGPGVTHLGPGDPAVVYPLMPCGTCHYCRTGRDNVCPQLKLYGVHVDGGYGNYAVAPAGNVLRIPRGLSFVEASAMSLYYPVAWHLLRVLGEVSPGQSVLIMAAGSGLGVFGLSVAKYLGARTIAAAGQDFKVQKALEAGASAALSYAREDFVDEVRRLTSGFGVDVVFENIGSRELWQKSMSSLTSGGRLVTCGSHGGGAVELNVRELYRRQLSVRGTQGVPRAMVDDVFALVDEGKLPPPVIDRTFPLEQAAEAHRYLIERKNFGRVVLTV